MRLAAALATGLGSETDGKHSQGQQKGRAEQAGTAFENARAEVRYPDRQVTRSADEETEAGTRNCTGLARHGAVEALALERSGQVAVVAAFGTGKQTGKELHDTSPCIDYTGCLRVMEWGNSLDGADIVTVCAKD